MFSDTIEDWDKGKYLYSGWCRIDYGLLGSELSNIMKAEMERAVIYVTNTFSNYRVKNEILRRY